MTSLQTEYDKTKSNMKEMLEEDTQVVVMSLTTSSGLSAFVWLQWWHTC
jgi:hypothetical protein